MKKILVISLLCLAHMATYAQKQQTNDKINGPVFKFKDSNVHDFGTIPIGPDVTFNFEFTNTGTKPLLITGAMASCGCTTPEWPKEPILPGKSNKIQVKFSTLGHPGTFSKTVFVYSNAITPAPGVYDLHIIGTVTNPNEPKKQ